MALLRRIARPMLSAIFISGGINALRSPQGHAQAAGPVLDAAAPAVGKVVALAGIDQPPDAETMVKIDAAVKITAGSLLALNKVPRLASAVLAASLVPTTLAGHRFWEIEDKAEGQAQQAHFFKNVSLLGGLLIASADTHGKPSLGWRRKRAGRLAATASAKKAGTASGAARKGRGAASGVAVGLAGAAAGRSSSEAGKKFSRRAAKASKAASKKADKQGADLRKVVEQRGAEWRKALEQQAGNRGAEWRKEAEQRRAAWEKQARKVAKKARKKAPEYSDQLSALAREAANQASKLRGDLAARGSDLGTVAGGAAKDVRKRAKALAG